MNFLAIDFETASRQRGSACAIGLVHVVEDEIAEERYSLIRPRDPYFDPFCEKVHGITWEDVKDSPTFEDLWPELSGYFQNNLVIAHNASFDISVLRHALDQYNIAYPAMEYNCTVSIAKKTWPEFYNFKLNTIAHHLDLQFEHHHALEDARVAARILMKASEIHNAFEQETLLKKLNMWNGTLEPGGYLTPGMNKKKQLAAKKAARQR
ncbi:3'-5' exonuclease [Salipaludibacillus aurantiacus]|uniref:DNA polymerase-3 subunit epsilon n=1 Tax=Salipaludibacillus aurantiacus TaxID=1601833 RepID=A0A1H9NUP8_9BACI|nr:3'-5' exonuclease [Salipaludibacillus aurantiacus]SER39690.1 DNA polymerase-3 subunit epsilon [Salipaludibacillus aurantiacus]